MGKTTDKRIKKTITTRKIERQCINIKGDKNINELTWRLGSHLIYTG
jgi:hypothetical protein